MKKAKCTLVDKAWVENHWVLIVWKLANMVCAWPSAQGDRWSFQEVLRQLLYRYEREINHCERPAIRLIQERDASPSSAMILCVFDITWPDDKKDSAVLPEFVLTDGWYKIRAKVDQALARAEKKGRIRIGAKLSIMGAKVR
jgi:breast cancer 2 susceptibility protein